MTMSKIKQNSIVSKFARYLPVFVILLAVTIIVGSTFAYFTDRIDEESVITFSKVVLEKN